MIYLDYAATTPMSESSIDAYQKTARRYFGNTKSLHDFGSSAERLVDAAREQIAGYLNAPAKSVYFTAGGSDSNALALLTLAYSRKLLGRHIITTATEHSSVANTLKRLESDGFQVTRIPVNQYGRVEIDELEKALTDETIIVAIQYVNSEIGTIQPVKEIGKLTTKHGILFHCDAVQAFGKTPIDVQASGIDSLSISSHKIYGPKGTGACYINPDVRWTPLYPGTTHENGFRPGTLDTPSIVAMATAASDMMENMVEQHDRMKQLRQKLIDGVQGDWDVYVEGDPEHHLPNIVGLRIGGIEGQYAMLECNRHGLAISTGSACQVGQERPSKTMQALDYSPDEGREFIRLSLGTPTTEAEIDRAGNILNQVCREHFRKLGTNRPETPKV